MIFEIRQPRPEEMPVVYDMRSQVLADKNLTEAYASTDEYDNRQSTIHEIARHGDLLVATGRLHVPDEEPGSRQVRYMATLPGYRKLGLGAGILWAMEDRALTTDGSFDRFMANARLSAMEFWEAVGYRAVGGVFEQVGILHTRVEKQI